MYTTSWCGYLQSTQSADAAFRLGFREVNIEGDPDAATFVGSVNGGNHIVPTVVLPDGTTMTNPGINELLARGALRARCGDKTDIADRRRSRTAMPRRLQGLTPTRGPVATTGAASATRRRRRPLLRSAPLSAIVTPSALTEPAGPRARSACRRAACRAISTRQTPPRAQQDPAAGALPVANDVQTPVHAVTEGPYAWPGGPNITAFFTPGPRNAWLAGSSGPP